MKTVQDYMNDPRILNDKGLMNGPEEIRIIHAARLRLQDETAGMATAERSAYLRKKTEAAFAHYGFPPPEFVNLSGQGKLKPRRPLTP
jgi:hypothetical protein